MPEEFSASTESAPDSTSSNVGEATSAGSAGAGEQTGQAADPNVSAAPESQIDIGWSFEDKPEEQALPETDEQIQEMLKDPRLDQERAPDLVVKLRNAWKEATESRKQANELRQQIAQFEQFGGFEGVSQAMGLVNGLLTNPQTGTTDFLGALYNQAYPSYESLVHSVIDANADYVVERLQQTGRLPADFTQRRGGSVDLTGIPESLHATASNLTADEWAEFDELQTEQARLGFLSRIEKLNRLDSNQRSQAEQSWRQQVSQARQQGEESLNQIASSYESAHFKELSKWKPLGPDNEPQNQTIYKMAWEGAFAELLSDQKFGQMYQDAYNLLREAPMRRLRNESFAADQDERKARQMAAQVNTRLGQVLRERVRLLDSVFRDARAYRESQRSNIPQRTEISGMSSTAGSGDAPPTLVNGKVNPRWMDHMISRLPGRSRANGG